MKTKMLNRSFALSAAVLAAFALAVSDVHAGGRSGTVNGPRGGTATRQVDRAPGNFSASGSATLANGKTAARSLTTQKTEAGRTTSGQATGFNGKTATYDSTRTRTENGFTREATATGPNGGTATKEVNVSKENGGVTRTVTATRTPPKS